jgi:hypothetical protein
LNEDALFYFSESIPEIHKLDGHGKFMGAMKPKANVLVPEYQQVVEI